MRIDAFLESIGTYWKNNPDLRFYQMLFNLGIYDPKRDQYNDEESHFVIDVTRTEPI